MLVSKKKENSDVQVMGPSFDPGRQDQFHLTTRLQQNYCRIRKECSLKERITGKNKKFSIIIKYIPRSLEGQIR